MTGVERGADPEEDGTTYRWLLWRQWAAGPTVTWVMLNPSTASAARDDPTIRRCVAFSTLWGFGRLEVVNLYALRATQPRDLWTHPDPIGPGNDERIHAAAERADTVVAAWGVHGERDGRGWHVLDGLRRHCEAVRCLGTTLGGQPKHPVRLARVTPLAVLDGAHHG